MRTRPGTCVLVAAVVLASRAQMRLRRRMRRVPVALAVPAALREKRSFMPAEAAVGAVCRDSISVEKVEMAAAAMGMATITRLLQLTGILMSEIRGKTDSEAAEAAEVVTRIRLQTADTAAAVL